MKAFISKTVGILAVVLLVCSFPLPSSAATPSPRVIVDQVVKDYIRHAHSGVSIIKTGSWVGENKRYKSPLSYKTDFSDHDMTLVLQPGTDKRKALAEWKKARAFIMREVRRKLLAGGVSSKEIERVIGSISLYPPKQLVEQAKSLKDAKNLFKVIDNGKPLAPCLGKDAEIEGIFGPGGKAFRQHYESKCGSVVYKVGNKVREGFPDLNHMMEGYGKFTVEGTANISYQFASKTAEAIELGNAKDVGKNLERLNMYYRKTKSLAGVRLSGTTGRELEDLSKSFRTQNPNSYGAWLEENADRIKRTLSGAEEEMHLCVVLAKSTDPRDIKLTTNILARETPAWKRFYDSATGVFRKVGRKVPWRALLDGMNKAMWLMTTHEAVEIYRNEGAKATVEFLTKNIVLANLNLPVSLTFSLAEVMAKTALQRVEKMGLVMVTRYQECDQLVAGIYMVKGREKVGEGMDIAKMAQVFTDEAEVLAFVERQAEKASERDIKSSPDEEKRKDEIKKMLMARCGKKIIMGWRDKRNDMIGVLLKLKNELDEIMSGTIMDLTCKEVLTSKGRHLIQCQTTPSSGRRRILDVMMRMSNAIKDLGGVKRVGTLALHEVYLWTVDGKTVRETVAPSIEYGAGGSLLLGQGTATKLIPLKAGSRHSIGLKYRLSVSPELILAGDLQKFKDKLTQDYSFSAKYILEDRKVTLKITGPREIALGDTLALKAELRGDSASSDSSGKPFKVLWFNETEKLPSKHLALDWKPTTPGRYRIRAVLYRDGERLDESFCTVRVGKGGFIRRFLAVDATDGKPLRNFSVKLIRMDGLEVGERRSASGKVSFGPLTAGAYIYRCRAIGYKAVRGNSVFNRSGKTIIKLVPESEQPKRQALIPGAAKVLAFKLNHSSVVMGLNENIALRASVVIGTPPYIAGKNVTSEVEWASDHPDIIVQTAGGVIVSGDKEGMCRVRARYRLKDGGFKDAFCVVTVRDRSAAVPLPDFEISPSKSEFKVGELVTFTQKIEVSNPEDYYFIWYLNTKEKRGPSIQHIFTEPGNYAVRLVVKSKTTGKEDALAKTIHVVENERESPATQSPIGKPYFKVSAGPYQVGREIAFTSVLNLPEAKIQFWVVKHEGVAKKVENHTRHYTFVPNEGGKYGIAVAYFESQDDRSMHSLTRWIHVETGNDNIVSGGNTTNGIIGSHINRFDIKKIAGTPITQVRSSFWREGPRGKGYWTPFTPFEKIAKTRRIILKTGDQSDGYNTGWLVFVPKKRNEIQFRVYHFDFAKHEGVYHYGGTLDLHGKEVDPASLSFVEVHTRAAVIQWKAADGSIGRVRISKYRSSRDSYVTGGIKEVFFTDAGVASTEKGKASSKKTPWKEIGRGVEIRFDKDRRCEVRVRRKPYIEVEIIALRYLRQVCKINDVGECASNAFNQGMRLNPGTHRLPLPGREAVKGTGINSLWYFFYSDDGHLMGSVKNKVGNNALALALDKDLSQKQNEQVKLLTYHSSAWPVRLKNGRLEAAGDQLHKNTWGKNDWRTIGDRVSAFVGVGTGMGPAIIYRRKNTWTVVLIHFSTGQMIKQLSRNEPIAFSGGGKRFGVIIAINGRCYDFSSNNRLRTPELDCKTHRWTGGELH